jgi:hypothetical protein
MTAIAIPEAALALADAAADVVATRNQGGDLEQAIRLLADSLGDFNTGLAGQVVEPTNTPASDVRANRFRRAVDIADPGACNPSGIALAIYEACQDARSEGVGTARDPAIRLMVTQLAYVCDADSGIDDYGRILAHCRARAGIVAETVPPGSAT